jgi:hypothetical protein
VAFGAAVLTASVLSGQAPSGSDEGRSPSVDPAAAAAFRARGLRLGYDLDRDAAIDAFREAMAADPTHPAAYRLTAATVWIAMLFHQGAVTAEDYLGEAQSGSRRGPPPAQLASVFRTNLDRAITLADERCRADCSADAHFQLGAAYAYQATYAATIEGSLFGSLRAARRAYAEHQRVLDLDPTRRDAGLTVGLYRYAVSAVDATENELFLLDHMDADDGKHLWRLLKSELVRIHDGYEGGNDVAYLDTMRSEQQHE